MGRGSSKAGGGLKESGQKPSVGGGANQPQTDPITVQPFNPDPIDLKAALGDKRRAIPAKQALEGANPFFYGGTEGDFTTNCQRSAVAYELRRRGYDVIALPSYASDDLGKGGKWLGSFRQAKSINVGDASPKKTQDNIEAKMKEWGNGARGIVRIPGHVFNVENIKGKTWYIDAQDGTVYKSKNVFSEMLGQTSNIKLVRTDNLRLSYRAKKAVTPMTDTVKMIVKRKKG